MALQIIHDSGPTQISRWLLDILGGSFQPVLVAGAKPSACVRRQSGHA
jgi:hypothetical protein